MIHDIHHIHDTYHIHDTHIISYHIISYDSKIGDQTEKNCKNYRMCSNNFAAVWMWGRNGHGKGVREDVLNVDTLKIKGTLIFYCVKCKASRIDLRCDCNSISAYFQYIKIRFQDKPCVFLCKRVLFIYIYKRRRFYVSLSWVN